MATVDEAIIIPAFSNELAVTTPGEVLAASMLDAAFVLLNQGIDGLSAEQALAYVVYHQAFTLTAGLSTYTVGTAGTLVSTARPERITGWTSYTAAGFRTGGQIISIEALHAQAKDPLGSLDSVLPQMVAADQAYPAINLEVFPKPAASPGTLALDYYSATAQFAARSTTVTLPSGYVDLLRTMLAVMLYPSYARVAGNTLEVISAAAQNAKGRVVTKNAAILGIGQAA